MTMFNWQASGTSSGDEQVGTGEVLSSSFWVFWAAALPLTFAILIAYRIWWSNQKKFYQKKFGVDLALSSNIKREGSFG
jgi:hypothetical protein